jgi:hypothetical protein
MRMTSDLPDKERILTHIIRELLSTQIMKMPWNMDYSDGRGRTYVHFVSGEEAVQPGDLVICFTSGIHDFTISWVVEKLAYSEYLLREIGSNRTCRMGNESVYIIRGLTEPWTWEGDKYDLYRKVWKAFWKAGDDWYRFGGLTFNDQGEAVMTVREKFGGMLSVSSGQESVPFTVTMPWTKRTSVKAITKALIDGGVGTHKFERRPIASVQPTTTTAEHAQ